MIASKSIEKIIFLLFFDLLMLEVFLQPFFLEKITWNSHPPHSCTEFICKDFNPKMPLANSMIKYYFGIAFIHVFKNSYFSRRFAIVFKSRKLEVTHFERFTLMTLRIQRNLESRKKTNAGTKENATQKQDEWEKKKDQESQHQE